MSNSTLSNIVSNLVAAVKGDLEKAALPLLATFFTNIAANPSELNIIAQVAKLQADLVAALPGIEQSVLASLAAQVSAEATALAAKTSG